MGVKQMIEGMKELSDAELEELYYALEREYLMRSSHEASKRWAGKTFELHSPPVAAPKHSPRLLFMDLRTNLPFPEQPTAEKLEELRP